MPPAVHPRHSFPRLPHPHQQAVVVLLQRARRRKRVVVEEDGVGQGAAQRGGRELGVLGVAERGAPVGVAAMCGCIYACVRGFVGQMEACCSAPSPRCALRAASAKTLADDRRWYFPLLTLSPRRWRLHHVPWQVLHRQDAPWGRYWLLIWCCWPHGDEEDGRVRRSAICPLVGFVCGLPCVHSE